MRKTTFLGVVAATALCATVAAVAQEVQEASAPSPEALARMTPGPMHAKLEALVGSWQVTGKWRMTPDGPWQEFDAPIEREWILGGRFVQETIASEFMGQPFEGVGIFGYDNTREEFTMVWFDTMSTGTMFSTGRMEGTSLTFEGESSNAMTGEKNHWSKSVTDMSGDRHTFTGYGKDANGDVFQNMEGTATRR